MLLEYSMDYPGLVHLKRESVLVDAKLVMVNAGDAGFKVPNKDWMDNRMVRTSYNADHFSFRMSRQMLPCLSTFGWKHEVVKRTCGAEWG